MNLKIKPTSELSYQAQQQLEYLNNRLNPYLEQYDNCRNNIVETYRHWRNSVNKSAIEYAEPFIEGLGISKGYLSKLNQIDKFKSEYRKLWCIHDNDNDEFLNWYDSHGTEKCYLLCKAGLDKASQLQMSNEKVSRRNLKEYIAENRKPDPKQATYWTPTDVSRQQVQDALENRDQSQLKKVKDMVNNPDLKYLNEFDVAYKWSIIKPEELIKIIKQKLVIDSSEKLSDFESELRQMLIATTEERDKKKRLQQLNLISPTTTNN